MKSIRYYIDKMELIEHTAHLTGWAVSMDSSPLTVCVTRGGQEEKAVVRTLSRPDASRAVFGDDRQPDCGFDLRFPCMKGEKYEVVFSCASGQVRVKVTREGIQKESGRRLIPFRRMVRMTSPSMVAADFGFLLKKGPSAWKQRLVRRYETDENKYLRWLAGQRAELAEQAVKDRERKLTYGKNSLSREFPTVSIVVPLYNTPTKFYLQMVDSVLSQTYENWQLCLADGSDDGADRKSCLPDDSRICYRKLPENLGISGNTNEALALAEGQWIAFLDHDDILEAEAVGEMVREALRSGADMVYSDEDKVAMDLRHFYEPHFKSDFNPDLLRSTNYICHFLMVEAGLVARTGGFRREFDGAQDYDFVLRASEQAVRVAHVPRVLYHWRAHPSSTAQDTGSKGYAWEAGRRAIEEHLLRMQIRGTVMQTERPGYYRVRYEADRKARISIIIPNKDQADTLRTCVESIRSKTDWPDYEILIVENNSTTEEIWEYYKELEETAQARILRWQGEFNYSAVNNFGVSHASGEYVVLLNNDTEIISEDWLSELAGICRRPEVGVAGARLLYPDGTVQHAGVVMKLAGCCGHVFYGAEKEDPGSFARAVLIQDYSAVTGACLMCRREVWDRLGGLDTAFQVAYNDVDFCLRARDAGLLVVYDPYAQAWHYESKTRGYEEGSEKQARFLREQKLLKERYPQYMEKGDPYYNPNLTLTAPDFSGCYLHESEWDGQ